MTLSSKLILLAIACMYFSLTQKLKTLHIGCLHLFVQFSKVYFICLTTFKSYQMFKCLSSFLYLGDFFIIANSNLFVNTFLKYFLKKLSKSF